MSTAPEFENVSAPSLAIFADDQVGRLKEALDPVERKADREMLDRLAAFHHRGAENIRQSVKNSRVIELPDTSHSCILHREAEVVGHIRDFLSK